MAKGKTRAVKAKAPRRRAAGVTWPNADHAAEMPELEGLSKPSRVAISSTVAMLDKALRRLVDR